MAFFYIYSVNKAIEILIDIETINAAFEPVPEDTCESDVTPHSEAEKERMKEEYEACISYMQSWATTLIFLLSITAICISFHFCLVLYTHWKNSSLPVSKGGLSTDPMNSAVVEFKD